MLALRLCNVNTSNLQHASRNGGKLRNAVAYVLPRGLGEAGQRLTIYSGVGARSKARSPNRVVGRFAAQLHQTRPKRRRLGRAGLERKDIGMGQKEALGLLVSKIGQLRRNTLDIELQKNKQTNNTINW